MDYQDRVTIATPEGVDLDLELAGIGSRFIAELIDQTIQGSVILAAGVLLLGGGALLEGLGASGGGGVGAAIFLLLAFLMVFGYHVAFEVRAGGRTPGKRAAGLRVVRAGGRPVGFVASLIRNILRLIDFIPLAYGVGMGAMLATRHNQRLGDLAAGTLVVREALRPEPSAAPTIRAESSPAPGWDVSAVSPEELMTVRSFLERRFGLTSEARLRLAAELAGGLRPKVAGAGAEVDEESFLEGVSAAKAARG